MPIKQAIILTAVEDIVTKFDLSDKDHDLLLDIVINLYNPAMVGHSPEAKAAQLYNEFRDTGLDSRLLKNVLGENYVPPNKPRLYGC